VVPKSDLRKNGLLLELSLCLSRAYLGKMFDFIDKWLKKTVLTHGCKGGDHEDLQGRRRRRRRRKRKHSTIKLSCEIRIEKI
jgi:hypothetical protein